MITLFRFPECNTTLGVGQPEYFPMPAIRVPGTQGQLIFCWQLGWRDRLRVLCTGKLWHSVLTFGSQLQPQKLMTGKPGEVSRSRMSAERKAEAKC